MILSRRVALGGVQMDEIHEAIVIRAVDPGVPRETISTVSRMGGWGQRVTGQHWDMLEVSVTYAINVPKRQMALRRQIFDAVNAWAVRKGWLTANFMTGKRVHIDKVVIPGSGDLFSWNEEYTVVFRAYEVPFWQETTAGSTISIEAGESGSGSFTVNGNVDTVADAVLTNAGSATVNNCEIVVDGSIMTFANLGLAVGESLIIDHTDSGRLQIRIMDTEEEYRDAMSHRTPESADDLVCGTGVRFVRFEADDDCALTVSCKGRFL